MSESRTIVPLTESAYKRLNLNREEGRQRNLHIADRFGRQRMVCTGQPMWFVFGAEPCQIGHEILGGDLADLDVADVVRPQFVDALVTIERRGTESFRRLVQPIPQGDSLMKRT